MKNRKRMTQTVVLLGVFGLAALVGCSDGDSGSPDTPPPSAPTTITMDSASNLTSGETTYSTACIECHGAQGTQQGRVNNLSVGPAMPPAEYSDFTDLMTYIAGFMPQNDPGSCTGDCARDVAAYVLCEFNDGIIPGDPPTPGGNDIAEGCPPS